MGTTMSHGSAGDAAPVRGGTTGLLLLGAAALLGPLVLAAGLATDAWGALVLAAAAAGLAAWSLADARVTVLVAVLLGSFVDYNTGRLTFEFAILFAWIAWSALVMVWRSAWVPWTPPPRAMLPGLGVWLGAVGLGTVLGLLRGNAARNLGLEVIAALWPAAGLAMLQVFGRRSLAYAGIALFAVAMVHTGFGLTMLQIHHQRLGGIYFTTITGIVAVGLWTAAMLAPRRSIRALCLAGMIPMLAHLFFSFTRGYWLGFLAGIAVATVLAGRNLRRHDPSVRLRRLFLIPALFLMLVAGIGASLLAFGGGDLLASAGERFSSSFSTRLSGETLSNVIRLDEYDRAIGAALESPVVGKGFGYSFITRDLLTRVMRDQWFVHNYYLLIWLKLGLVGLAAFAFLIGSFTRSAMRLARRDGAWLVRTWAIAAIATTAQVLVILLTNYSLADVTTATVVAFVWGVFWSIRPDPERSVPG